MEVRKQLADVRDAPALPIEGHGNDEDTVRRDLTSAGFSGRKPVAGELHEWDTGAVDFGQLLLEPRASRETNGRLVTVQFAEES